MMAFVGRSLPILVLLLVFALPSQAQLGTIQGTVLDPDGDPLNGADVLFELQGDTPQSFETRTGRNGTYEQGELPPGVYSITLERDGDPLAVIGGVRVAADAVRDVNFDLGTILSTSEEDAEAAASAAASAAAAREAFDLGIEAMDAGDYDTAVGHLTTAFEADPTQHVIAANLAVALDSAERYEEAITAYEQAIELANAEVDAEPQPAYYSNLAPLYARTGAADRANETAETLAGVDPAMAGVAYYNIGAILINQGLSTDATTSFSRAIEINPEMAEAYYQLGISYFGSPDTIPDAVPMLEKYLELAPEGPNAEAARGLIAAAQQ